MEKFMSVVVVFGVVAAVLLQRTAAQTTHVVGDSLNWIVPIGNMSAYATWAASKKFMVDDTLVFNFATNAHDVLEVQKESYDACSSDKAIGNTITTGPANITLNSTGNHYYICTFGQGQHCKSGQKLSIDVSASTASAPTPGEPSGQTTPPPPPPPPSPGSSSSGVFVSFFVCFFSIAIGFLF